jgi:hypothetical protein
MCFLLFFTSFSLFGPSIHIYVAIDWEVVLYCLVKWLLVDVSGSCL